MATATPTSQRAACHHCGAACPNPGLEADGNPFCCTGCRTVFELLRNHGLEGYYTLEARPGVRRDGPDPTPGRFAYLDEDSVKAQLLDFDDGRHSTLTLHLPQIHCASCVWLLENLHRLDPGVRRAEVDFLRRDLHLDFDPRHTSLRRLVETLAALGYEPRLTLGDAKAGSAPPADRHQIPRLAVAGFCFGNAMLFSFPEYLAGPGELESRWQSLFAGLNLLLALPVLLYSAAEFFQGAWHSLRQRRVTLDVPIALGLAALFGRSLFNIAAGGSGYIDSFTGLVFFLLVGRSFQRRSFAALTFDRDYRSYFPLAVTALDADGERSLPVGQLRPGHRIRLRHGELVPADSRLLSKRCRIDYSYVTGEADPVAVEGGQTVRAGGRVDGPAAELAVEREVSQSYLTRLWNHEVFAKEGAQLAGLADRFSRHFTLAVLALALGAALYWASSGLGPAAEAFTAVLIVACPCALALATPFTLGTALNVLARAGLYLKDAAVVERLARIDAVVFDKTGTLTATGAAVSFSGPPLDPPERGLLAAALGNSAHPLSRRLAVGLGPATAVPAAYEEVAGQGLRCQCAGHTVLAGAAAWLASHGIATGPTGPTGPQVHIALDGAYRGCFALPSTDRTDLDVLVQGLADSYGLHLLSGDNDRQRPRFEALFGRQRVHFGQSPAAKLDFIAALEADRRSLMVGDGLNDAGALKRASVGLAVTEDAGAFSPACDGILEAAALEKLPDILRFARACVGLIIASLALSLAYNAVGLYFAVAGQLSPLVCAVLMPLSSVSVVAFATLGTRLAGRRLKGTT